MATGGAVQALFAPQDLLRLELPSVPYTAAIYPLFPQHAGAWLMLAFHDAVTLRLYPDDVRVWKLVLGAGILSDLGYVYSLFVGMGGAARFLNPGAWSAGEAFTVVTTVVPLAVKVAFELGVGLGEGKGKGKGKGKGMGRGKGAGGKKAR